MGVIFFFLFLCVRVLYIYKEILGEVRGAGAPPRPPLAPPLGRDQWWWGLMEVFDLTFFDELRLDLRGSVRNKFANSIVVEDGISNSHVVGRRNM